MISFSIATLNLRNRMDRWYERRELIVAEILTKQPDILALQELSMPIGQGRWLRNQVNLRSSGKSGRPYRLIQRRKQHLVEGYKEGVGFLCKLPVVAQSTLGLGYRGRIALRITVELPTGQLVDVICTHFHHGPENVQARHEQAMRLVGWLAQDPNRVPYQVLAGDFNDVPDSLAIEAIKQAYRSAFAVKHGHDPLATFPTALTTWTEPMAVCLDYIFISAAIRQVEKAEIFASHAAANDDTLYPSDHVGLMVTLKL
ncbi:MAG: endonuclease/exonuclease/phosphatase family protein [Chloroflexi bacterium]|nr:endonuclease/exonuclease/phosphatase family protein [Chloroflexota bacterium]MBP8057284.1 endonuclease/exonuclease/phosphatase family protein [Chloroflexota bacterium]